MCLDKVDHMKVRQGKGEKDYWKVFFHNPETSELLGLWRTPKGDVMYSCDLRDRRVKLPGIQREWGQSTTRLKAMGFRIGYGFHAFHKKWHAVIYAKKYKKTYPDIHYPLVIVKVRRPEGTKYQHGTQNCYHTLHKLEALPAVRMEHMEILWDTMVEVEK